MKKNISSYLKLDKNELLKRSLILKSKLQSCDICPLKCRVNRLKNEKGRCKTGNKALVASFCPHHGEERPISGIHGSGTIFFSGCNLNCRFCQNYDISHLAYGHEADIEDMANMMIKLQALGCHNINFVSPTHVISQIVEALLIAIEKGLKIPLVYNTGGYDSVETLELLDGMVDIYMPDMKYGNSSVGEKLSGIPDYVNINFNAVLKMHDQVGDLIIDENGIAQRGLLVRHLVLPENLAGTEIIVDFLVKRISSNTYINIMDQYYPCYKAKNYKELTRRTTISEFKNAVRLAENQGLHRFDRNV